MAGYRIHQCGEQGLDLGVLHRENFEDGVGVSLAVEGRIAVYMMQGAAVSPL